MGRTFSPLDYVIFSSSLIISLLIGIYFACCGGKQKTNAQFLMANRKMGILPAAMSILATFHSAIMIIGTPAEAYKRGIYILSAIIVPLITVTITAELFLPIFFKLKLVSVYEHLELRFKSKPLRVMTSMLFVLQMSLYMAVVVYAPAIALNTVTGLSSWVSVLLMGLIGTIYTTIGGLQAVMWTDTFQSVVMLVGIFAIIIQGSIDLGSFTVAFTKSHEGGRIIFADYDQNPFMYQNLTAHIIGASISSLAVYAANQAQIQRYCSMKTVRSAKIALYTNIPLMYVSYTLVIISALIIYATFKDCDLVEAKIIQKSDELVPFYVMYALHAVPGLPGLMVSSLFCASMSTISSGLNSIAAVIWEDVLKVKFTLWQEDKKTYITKSIVLVFGIIVVILTQIVAVFDRVVQASIILNGVVNGAVLGIFLLALFIPFCNSKGAIIGGLAGLVANVWVAVGAQLYNQLEGGLPTTTSNCTAFTLYNNLNNVSQFLPLNMSEQDNAFTTSSEYFFNSTEYQTLISKKEQNMHSVTILQNEINTLVEENHLFTTTSEYLANSTEFQTFMPEKEQNMHSVTIQQDEINTLAEESHTFSYTVTDYLKYLVIKKKKKRKPIWKKKTTALGNIVNTTELGFAYQSNNTEISSIDSKVLTTDELSFLGTKTSPNPISSYATFSPIFKFTYLSFINDYISTKKLHENVITVNPIIIPTTEFTELSHSNTQIISRIPIADTSIHLEETDIADNFYDQTTSLLEIIKPTTTESPIADMHNLVKNSHEELHQTTEIPLQQKPQNTDKYYTNLHNSKKFFLADMITSIETDPPYMFMYTDLELTNKINLTNVSPQNILKQTELSFPQALNYTEILHPIHDFTDLTSGSLDRTEYLYPDMHASSNIPLTHIPIFSDITATDTPSSINTIFLSRIHSLKVTNTEMLTQETVYDKQNSDMNTATSFLTNTPEMLTFTNATDKSMLEIHHSNDNPLAFNLIIEHPVSPEPVLKEISETEMSKSPDELTKIPTETTKISTKVDSKQELTGIMYMYKLSMLWRVTFGCLVTIIIGIIVSLLTGPTKIDEIEDGLLSPLVLKLLNKTHRVKREKGSSKKGFAPEEIRLHNFNSDNQTLQFEFPEKNNSHPENIPFNQAHNDSESIWIEMSQENVNSKNIAKVPSFTNKVPQYKKMHLKTDLLSIE